MRSTTTIVLLGVAALAVAGVVVLQRLRPTTEAQQEQERTLLQMPPESIQSLEIGNSAGKISLKKEDGEWKVTSPYADRADGSAVSEILKLASGTQVMSRRKRSEVAEAGRGMAAFGLDEASAVTVSFQAGTPEATTIRIGTAAPYEGGIYAQAHDAEELLIIYSTVKGVLSRPPTEFRDPRLLTTLPKDIVALSVKNTAGGFEAKRTLSGGGPSKWELAQDTTSRASQETLSAMVEELCQARTTAFLEMLPDGEPVATVTVSNASGTEETLKIFAGSDETHALVVWPGRAVAGKVTPDVLALAKFDSGAVRGTTLGALDPESIKGVELDALAVGKKISLFENKRRWYVTSEGATREASATRVKNLIKAINEASAEAMTEPGDYGLTQPTMILRFGQQSAANPGQIAALDGPSLTIGTQNNRMYGRWSTDSTIWLFASTLMAQLPLDTVKWRTLNVIGFSRLWIKSLSITQDPAPPIKLTLDFGRGSEPWSAEREGQDITALLDTERVELLAQKLSTLSAADWAADPGPGIEATTRRPTLVFTIVLENPTKENVNASTSQTHTIRLAPTAPGAKALYYGRLDDEPEVFIITKSTIDDLAKPLLRAKATE